MTAFPPLTHVALTVRDLSVSVPWYEALFGADPVIDEDTVGNFHHTVYLLGNGTLIGLHQHRTPAPPETWTARLDELGIEHGEIEDAHYGSDVSFRDPDGIALEFFAPPS